MENKNDNTVSSSADQESTDKVDIEAIMNDIRTEIREKGYTSDMLSFEEAVFQGGKLTSDGDFDRNELSSALSFMNESCFIVPEIPLTGNFIAVFIKKVIRKLIRFYIFPIVEQINNFNAQSIRAANSFGKYIEKNEEEGSVEQLAKRVSNLELQLTTVSRENQELRRKLEQYTEKR